MSVTSSTNPVDAVIDIIERVKQYEHLVIESGMTKTIPENEIWFVSREIVIEGELIIEGELLNGSVYQTENQIIESGETKTIPENEIKSVSGEFVTEGELIIEGKLLIEGGFQTKSPVVDRSDEVAPKARENRKEDAIYVMSSLQNTFERFGVDPGNPEDLLGGGIDRHEEDATVLALVYSLDERRAIQIARGLTVLFKLFQSDNYTFTDFHSLEPESIIDNRAQTITRQTNHYVFGVEISTHRLE